MDEWHRPSNMSRPNNSHPITRYIARPRCVIARCQSPARKSSASFWSRIKVFKLMLLR